jgi:DNA-binding NarL/FixJ family response regulator
MPARAWDLARLVDDLERLGARGLPRERYFQEVGLRLRRVVATDAACWHTLDPATRLITSAASGELVDAGIFDDASVLAAGARIVASEYVEDDLNAFSALAARRVPVASLERTTQGRPERSARWRELLAPAGIPHELRAAFVVRGRCWGAVALARRKGRPGFDDADVAAIARIAGVVADGIRTSLRVEAGRHGAGGSGPGMLVLGPGDEVELVTSPALELLAAMRSGGSDAAPPGAVLALAAHVRGSGRACSVAVPTADGWVTLHASQPDAGTARRVAIVCERSATPAATAVRLESHGVTAREREIAGLLAHGLTNPEIATRLVLSPYTVQDHVKRLFEKTGVATRQELVARIFLDDYLPQITAGASLGADGAFIAQGPGLHGRGCS